MFGWFHEALPPEWQWISLILAVLALLMTVPTILTMIWGGPELSARFTSDTDAAQGIRFLRCQVFNRPIEHPVLQFLRVRRERAYDVAAELEVREDGTNRLVDQVYPKLQYPFSHDRAQVLNLSPSPAGAQFPVAAYFIDENLAVVSRNRKRGADLPPGLYVACVRVRSAGSQPQELRQKFRVGRSVDEITWLS